MQTLGEVAAKDTRNHTITQQEFSDYFCESVRSLCSVRECRRRQVVQLNSERVCLDVQRFENDFNKDCDAVSYKGQPISFFLVLFTCPFPKLYWFTSPVKKNSSPKQMLSTTPNSAS
jgi:hypothetical protein